MLPWRAGKRPAIARWRSPMMIRTVGVCSAWLLLVPGVLNLHAAEEKQAVATRAHAILEQYCHRCHGKDGTLEGGMGFILDRDKLIARKKIIPNDARASLLYRKVSSGKMPPPD